MGRPVTLRISGALQAKWGKGFVNKADFAIVAARENGTSDKLWGQSLFKPESLESTLPVQLETVTVGPNDRILVSAAITDGNGYNASLIVKDDLAFELVNQ